MSHRIKNRTRQKRIESDQREENIGKGLFEVKSGQTSLVFILGEER